MNLALFKQQLIEAVDNNTLLTPKHDPNNLSTIWPKFRSVLSHEASASLETFIKSGDYTVYEYENINPFHNPHYMKIIPNPSSSFSIIASGVTACSPIASTILDSLVVVSGSSQGWHIFGVDNNDISNKVLKGNLKDKGILL